MGRYDLNKIPDDASTPAQPVKSSSNPHVEPMEVKFLFDTEEGKWFIEIIKEKENKKEIVKFITGAGYREIRRFSTLNEAQEWCEKVGLL
jgi:hypothetical protein